MTKSNKYVVTDFRSQKDSNTNLFLSDEKLRLSDNVSPKIKPLLDYNNIYKNFATHGESRNLSPKNQTPLHR